MSSDEEDILGNDDYDIEILSLDDANGEQLKSKNPQKGGKKNENIDDDDEKDERDEGDERDEELEDPQTIEEAESDMTFLTNTERGRIINEVVNKMRKPPVIPTNELYNGITDLVKYSLFEKRVDVEEYIVPPKNQKTKHILGKAEKTELIGVRAQHIAMGAEPYVDIENETDPVSIAEKELKQKKFPLLIKRRLNEYTYEIWDPNNMTVVWLD